MNVDFMAYLERFFDLLETFLTNLMKPRWNFLKDLGIDFDLSNINLDNLLG